MKARKWGRIINIASAHGLVASPFKSAYVAAKHGILGLTKTVALETAEHGITVNAICPGYVLTPLVEKQIPETAKARGITEEQVIKDVLLHAQPTRQFVTTEQIGALAVVPVQRCRRVDHRHGAADRRRLDGAMRRVGCDAQRTTRRRKCHARRRRNADAAATSRTVRTRRQIVLVFQGGGALGAYQAGVYQALHEAGIEPDWIIGTSIGAINASLIAGNEPHKRLPQLKEFWDRMAYKSSSGTARPPGRSLPQTLSYWNTVTRGIPGFFEPNPLAFWGTHVPLGADTAGYYSTAPLEKTLLELVDFSLVNRCKPRLTVGAAHVRTSQMRYFDSRDMRDRRQAHHGLGRAAAGVPGRAHRRRALLGRRHSLQHADRGRSSTTTRAATR